MQTVRNGSVAHENLDHADVDVVLQEVRGEAVPQWGVTRFLIAAI